MSEKKKSWFVTEEPEKVKKKRRPRGMFTGAQFSRLVDITIDTEEPREFERLFMGDISEYSDPSYMRDKLISFWAPQPRTKDYCHAFYVNNGSMAGDLFADRLHRAGVLHCEDLTKPYEEFYLRDVERGLSGRIDLVIDQLKADAVGAKTPKPLKDDYEIIWKLGEVKQTNVRNYDMWENAYMLPVKYRTQFSLYLHYLSSGKYEIKTSDQGSFFIIQRDSPRSIKPLDYKMEPELVAAAFQNCENFWKHVQDRTFPAVKDLDSPPKKWIKECIKNQDARNWPMLGKIS